MNVKPRPYKSSHVFEGWGRDRSPDSIPFVCTGSGVLLVKVDCSGFSTFCTQLSSLGSEEERLPSVVKNRT